MKTHDYEKFAKSYAELEMVDSFYLAYRDIPKLIKKYNLKGRALDFGCGGGRSTRFLKKLGFDAVGVDISKDMIDEAKKRDSVGSYYHVKRAKFLFEDATFDFVFSSIVFLELSSKLQIKASLLELKRVLKKDGVIIIVTGMSEAYEHNWSSFICDFPENRGLKSGSRAKLKVRDTEIVLYDYVWFDDDYRDAFMSVGLRLVETQKPMPVGNEPYKWYAEEKWPLWAIYVLKK